MIFSPLKCWIDAAMQPFFCLPWSQCLKIKSRKPSKLPHFENYDAVTSIWLLFWRKIKMSGFMIFIDWYMHVVAKWEFSMDFKHCAPVTFWVQGIFHSCTFSNFVINRWQRSKNVSRFILFFHFRSPVPLVFKTNWSLKWHPWAC